MKRGWIIWWLLAIASTGGASAAGHAFDVRLTEPAGHVDVTAGSSVSIAWEAAALPPGVDEWEAFLSVNGGRTHPIRITPHLDTKIHRFTWTVPSLPGAEASILLRFGDEKDERSFSFPARIRIAGAGPIESFRTATTLRSEEENDHGETLAQWVEGPRNGSRSQQIFARGPLLSGAHELDPPRGRESTTTVSARSKRLELPAHRAVSARSLLRRPRRPIDRSPQSHPADVLIASGRLNI